MTRLRQLAISLLAASSATACSLASSPPQPVPELPDARPGVALKRASLWVSDLDRAIAFYRDVLGFSLAQRGPLAPEADSVLWALFNLPPDTAVERALFSSADAQRVLFVMAAEGAPAIARNAKRSPVLVVASDNLAQVIDQARRLGFEIGKGTATTAGGDPTRQLREQILLGPEGQPVLVYQLDER